MSEKKNNKNATNDAIIRNIRNVIADLDYGTVTIKVHNGVVAQIEVTTKRRFDDCGLVEKGGGI